MTAGTHSTFVLRDFERRGACSTLYLIPKGCWAMAECLTSPVALSEQHRHGSYNLTVISMFKDERLLIREWVQHYMAEEADHFILIDNNANVSNEGCELESYVRAGVVTLIHDGRAHAQLVIIMRHLRPFLSLTAWVLNVDLDDFAYARHSSVSLWHVLNQRVPTIAHAVIMPWKHFGGAGTVCVEPRDAILPRRRIVLSKDGSVLLFHLLEIGKILLLLCRLHLRRRGSGLFLWRLVHTECHGNVGGLHVRVDVWVHA